MNYGREYQDIIKNVRVFGMKSYIKRNDENLGKFEPKSDEGIFIG